MTKVLFIALMIIVTLGGWLMFCLAVFLSVRHTEGLENLYVFSTCCGAGFILWFWVRIIQG